MPSSIFSEFMADAIELDRSFEVGSAEAELTTNGGEGVDAEGIQSTITIIITITSITITITIIITITSITITITIIITITSITITITITIIITITSITITITITITNTITAFRSRTARKINGVVSNGVVPKNQICNQRHTRPVHLLRVSLLRVLESNFPGRPPIRFNGHENSHPLEFRVCLSQTL